jgi:hypothetical protein
LFFRYTLRWDKPLVTAPAAPVTKTRMIFPSAWCFSLKTREHSGLLQLPGQRHYYET